MEKRENQVVIAGGNKKSSGKESFVVLYGKSSVLKIGSSDLLYNLEKNTLTKLAPIQPFAERIVEEVYGNRIGKKEGEFSVLLK